MKLQKNAAEYLECLQKRVYSQLSKLERSKIEHSEDFYVKFAEELLRSMKPSKKTREIKKSKEEIVGLINSLKKMDVPTRYENPLSYGLMMIYAEQIEDAAKKLDYKITNRPLFGTLHTGRVNAMSIKIPDSHDYIVIFEVEFFMFSNLMSKVIVKVIPFLGNEDNNYLTFGIGNKIDIHKILDKNKDIEQRFQEVLFAYLLKGHPSAAPQYFIKNPYSNLHIILRDSMELFVMGHEYAHIIRGHLSKGLMNITSIGDEKINELIFNWRQEVEADCTGLNLMLQCLRERGYDLGISYWGADFFFSCVDIVERAVSIMRTGKEENKLSSSHPSTDIRRKSIRKYISKLFPKEESEKAIQTGTFLEKAVVTLWERTKPIVYKYHKSGKKLSPIWW